MANVPGRNKSGIDEEIGMESGKKRNSKYICWT